MSSYIKPCSVSVTAGEYCTTSRTNSYYYSSYQYEYEYCSYGCCGTYPNESCCGAYVWIIIVSVIGAIIFLSCVVAVICCVIKKKGHSGRVVQPAGTGVTMVTATNQSQAYGGYSQPGVYQQPPGYQQFPPGYQQQQPGPFNPGNQYPPPSVAYPPNTNPAFPPPKEGAEHM